MDTNKLIDGYIAAFPEMVQARLTEIREIVRQHAPDAEEGIGYQMPAFKLNGVLLYFGAYKHHLGFYPSGSAIEAFKTQLSDYKWSKGAIQFSHEKQLPAALIAEIVAFRVAENLAKKN